MYEETNCFYWCFVSLVPLGQSLLIKTGVTFSTLGVTLFVSKKVNTKSAEFYINCGSNELDIGDYKVAISDFEEVMQINPENDFSLFK